MLDALEQARPGSPLMPCAASSPGRDGYTFPSAPSIHNHRPSRQTRAPPARVYRLWARVGGVTPRTPIPECVDGDIADGHQSAAAVGVVCHAFHHTRNAVHSDRVS